MSELTPPDPSIDVTVCIVNWNGARWLPDCLRSLRESQPLRHEVILVDNASKDDSVQIVRAEFPEVELIVNSQNTGYAMANNQAIRRGRGRHFFILNNDTIMQEGSLARLVQFIEERPRAGMVAGHLVNPDGSMQFMYYHVALPTLASISADLFWLNRDGSRNRVGRGPLARGWDPTAPYQMEQIPGACMLVRREFFAQVGLFDETYSFWYEDVDLCARALRAGWEMWYVPNARIVHYGGASTKLMDISTRSLLRFRNMIRYAGKYFSASHYIMLKLIVGFVLIARLPLVVAASFWPQARLRRLWKGTWGAYMQLLGEIVRG